MRYCLNLPIGGGGWGATVTSTLLGSGHAPRLAIGSANTAEFFVAVAAATTFFVELRSLPIEALLGLTLGGVLAAPFGAYLTRVLPARPLMTAVGLLVDSRSIPRRSVLGREPRKERRPVLRHSVQTFPELKAIPLTCSGGRQA